MANQLSIVQVVLWLSVSAQGQLAPERTISDVTATQTLTADGVPSAIDSFGAEEALSAFGRSFTAEGLFSALSDNSTSDSLWDKDSNAGGSFEGRKKKKKHEMMMLTKLLMGLKVALLGVVLPIAIILAKLLSWKAVTLSLLAFMLAKIVFVKSLIMGKNPPAPSTPTAPATPIIIHSSNPPQESLWKRASHPKIHLQPEVHVHHSEEHHTASQTPTWTWAEESRAAADPHQLAFGNWLPHKAK